MLLGNRLTNFLYSKKKVNIVKAGYQKSPLQDRNLDETTILARENARRISLLANTVVRKMLGLHYRRFKKAGH